MLLSLRLGIPHDCGLLCFLTAYLARCWSFYLTRGKTKEDVLGVGLVWAKGFFGQVEGVSLPLDIWM